MLCIKRMAFVDDRDLFIYICMDLVLSVWLRRCFVGSYLNYMHNAVNDVVIV